MTPAMIVAVHACMQVTDTVWEEFGNWIAEHASSTISA